MGRMPRVIVPGNPHHVVQRGVRKMDIFRSDEDRAAYIERVTDACAQFGVEIWAWCLMSNHVHIVAVPALEDSLSRMMAESHRRYARRINRLEDVRGHLFQERFYSYPIQTDAHLLAVVRYIDMNPVGAGLASYPAEYRWSSARHYARGQADPLVSPSPLDGMIHDYAAFLDAAVARDASDREIERRIRNGRPLGTPEWIEALEQQTDRRLQPLRHGRPVTQLDV